MANPIGGSTDSDNGTITVPYAAGIVNGMVSLSAALTGLIGDSSKTAKPYVSISNDNSLADGTIVAQLALATPAIGLLALLGSNSTSTTDHEVHLNPKGTGTTTLTLHFNGATSAVAVFTGG